MRIFLIPKPGLLANADLSEDALLAKDAELVLPSRRVRPEDAFLTLADARRLAELAARRKAGPKPKEWHAQGGKASALARKRNNWFRRIAKLTPERQRELRRALEREQAGGKEKAS